MLITSACNSNCTHCFRSLDKNTKEIPFGKLKEIVDFGIENNCKQFSFSGGEFFTHPAAYELIDYCLLKNVRISILTNALQINIPFFEKVKNKELISFQISIDGLKEKHDMRRGKGSFEKTIANVKQLHKLGFYLSAKTVLDENNYTDIVDIFQMPWFSNILVLPVALSSQMIGNKIISPEYRSFEQTIELIYKTLVKNDNYKCRCYPQEIAIKYDGGVYPCTEAREHEEYLIGNITSKSIIDVLNEYELNQENKFVCPKDKIEFCETCLHNSICNHGCRLRALRFYGDIHSPDPFNCRIFFGKHKNIPIGKLFWGEK
ncbi:MAG: radical SAM protein [Erysipelotrichales bacterium]|nr:radical SAM protein [Erysipelotrichales bacterium]